MNAATEKYKAYVFVKRAGFKYENFRIELKNSFDAGNDSFPDDVIEASRKLDNWRPPIATISKTKDKALQFHQSKEAKGEQYYEQDKTDASNSRAGITCFKCEREGHYTKECTHDKKDNSGPLNDRDEVQKLYDERADAKRAKYKAIKDKRKTEEAGASHFMESAIESTDDLPEFEQAILEEDEHDGQGFIQDTMIIDLRGKNHVFNQTGSHESMKLFDVLLDSQSTCDVIVNGIFVTNIRKSKMTLVLRTQAGECRIDTVADLPGVGTIWYYPSGVANILSQHRMVTQSGWDIDYTSRLYRKTGNDANLKFNCTTSEDIDVSFLSNKDGLHILDCSKYVGVGKQGYVFGKSIIDNKTSHGLAMCHNVTGGVDNNLKDAIDTVEKSKQNFSKKDQLRAARVRRFQHVAAHPSDETIIYSAMTTSIKNSPITKRDVKMAYDMLG
jgi:hypothetical protein